MTAPTRSQSTITRHILWTLQAIFLLDHWTHHTEALDRTAQLEDTVAYLEVPTPLQCLDIMDSRTDTSIDSHKRNLNLFKVPSKTREKINSYHQHNLFLENIVEMCNI